MEPKRIIKNNEKFKTKWKFLLSCAGCGIEKEASYKYYQLIRHKDAYRCIKCAVDINRHIISENVKNSWQDPEYRNKVVNSLKGAFLNDTKEIDYFKKSLNKALKSI